MDQRVYQHPVWSERTHLARWQPTRSTSYTGSSWPDYRGSPLCLAQDSTSSTSSHRTSCWCRCCCMSSTPLQCRPWGTGIQWRHWPEPRSGREPGCWWRWPDPPLSALSWTPPGCTCQPAQPQGAIPDWAKGVNKKYCNIMINTCIGALDAPNVACLFQEMPMSHVSCLMSACRILKNRSVALSNLGVKGHNKGE